MTGIKCPNCGGTHYVYKHSMTTALGWVEEYKDGKLISQNPNTTTSYYTCCECNHNFEVEEQFGEIQSITDKGKPTEVPVAGQLLGITQGSTVDPNWFILKDTKADSNQIELPIKSEMQQLHEDLQEILIELRCLYGALSAKIKD